MKNSIHRLLVVSMILSSALFFLSCVDDCVECNTDYIEDFHQSYFCDKNEPLITGNVALYVDYSTCIANAMNDESLFFNDMVKVLTSEKNIGDYYSIKGNNIILETSDDKYSLLKTVTEVKYADIKTAAEKIANGDKEGILLTDGEFYQKNISKSNPNNPWMESAIVTWLSRGHEIYVFAEPYKEKHHGHIYDKKRYYFIFTDTKYDGNIYEFINETVTLKSHPQVEQYRLTANHYTLLTEGGNNSSTPNDNLGCKPTHCTGQSEVQVWDQLTWDDIYRYIANATTDDGTPLPNGKPILSLFLDRNSGGSCFRITDVDVRVSNISEQYNNFYQMLEAGQKPAQIAKDNPLQLDFQDNFIFMDEKEFKNHGKLDVYFDVNNFDPSFLDTRCDNLLKIDFVISDCDNNFTGKNKAQDIFTFPSIDKPGKMNTSLVASIQNALANSKVNGMMKDQVIYTVYVFSSKNNM